MTETKQSAARKIVETNGHLVKPTVRIQTITPAQAEKWLAEANIRNRDLRESRIVHLVENIKREEWKLTGDSIVFDLDGVLLNGQHRLSACVLSGEPIECVVLRNIPRENQDVMDDTLSRKLGDALRLRGETDVHRLGAGIAWYQRMVYAEMTGSPFYADNGKRPSIPQLLAVFDENQGLRDCLAPSRPVLRALKLRPGPLLAVWYRLSLVDAQEAEVFFDGLRSGAELAEGSPILALRRYCEQERNVSRARNRNPDFRWVAVVVKAWNAWREARPIKVLSFTYSSTSRESWPEPE
jgi:hypothetical protein